MVREDGIKKLAPLEERTRAVETRENQGIKITLHGL